MKTFPWISALACHAMLAVAADAQQALQSRIDTDVQAGLPIVAHVVVALCDNAHQGIVKVPAALGNGQDPANNLYWGARYGIRGWFARAEGWKEIPGARIRAPGLLDRRMYRTRLQRAGRSVELVLVAEAWDGREMTTALRRFCLLAAGHRAARPPHLVAFIGHNGFMDAAPESTAIAVHGAKPRAALALACRSRADFLEPIRRAGAEPLLLTTGFMAPEAYTLDAVLRSFAAGGDRQAIREAAAQAYHRYQKCGLAGARRLFFAP